MITDDLHTLAATLVVGLLAYLALVATLRVSGKRTLAQWNAFDAVVTFALGSMLATTVLSNSTSLAQGLVALALFVVLQLGLTWLSVRSARVRRLIKSEPALLLHRGQMLEEVMKRERVTRREVLAALREKGLASVGEAYAVVLGTTGKFSVIREPKGDDCSTLADVRGVDERSRARP
jgi:uncharacterized membrane protein YcaP (DUF421 family)